MEPLNGSSSPELGGQGENRYDCRAFDRVRHWEWVVFCFFAYLAFLGVARPLASGRRLLLTARVWSAPLPILTGYWA
jgi:hypothetical protein